MTLSALVKRLLGGQPQPVPPPEPSVFDTYVTSAPAVQNAVDLFEGSWSSQLPLDGVNAGPIPLFADDRVSWALTHLGDVTGKKVLELGPLEAGHTSMLVNAGASVLALESQAKAFMKCLIVKNALGLDAARFELGDFMEFLRARDASAERYDVVFASGVLYHMRNPVETIALTAQAADRLFLWTHYYDAELIAANEVAAPRFSSHTPHEYEGFSHTLHRFNYESALELSGFCGGNAPHAMWLSRDDLFGALERFGWAVDEVAFEQKDHPHGPALALVATRKF